MMEDRDKPIPWAAYLALEAAAPGATRVEYSYGTVVSQAVPSREHEEIVANLALLLGPTIRANGCRFFLRQNVRRAHVFSHEPDFVVTCSAQDLEAGERRTRGLIEHPALIVEVLSPSTRTFDLDDKVTNYGSFGSLLHYVIVDTTRRRITHLHRESGDAELRYNIVRERLVCSGFTPAGGVALTDIYANTYVPAIEISELV